MGDVVALPPQKKEGIRFLSVTNTKGEFLVGIEYWDGRYVFAGVLSTHGEALEAAMLKAKSLKARVVDFTFSDQPPSGDVA